MQMIARYCRRVLYEQPHFVLTFVNTFVIRPFFVISFVNFSSEAECGDGRESDESENLNTI